MSLRSNVQAFMDLLVAGQPLAAMERFYAEDVMVFENRELARAGRAACLAHERSELCALTAPLTCKLTKFAVNEQDGCAFLEYVLRFSGRDRRPMRLEQVAAQRWYDGKIVEERFYYEGLVDEGDEGDEGAA